MYFGFCFSWYLAGLAIHTIHKWPTNPFFTAPFSVSPCDSHNKCAGPLLQINALQISVSLPLLQPYFWHECPQRLYPFYFFLRESREGFATLIFVTHSCSSEKFAATLTLSSIAAWILQSGPVGTTFFSEGGKKQTNLKVVWWVWGVEQAKKWIVLTSFWNDTGNRTTNGGTGSSVTVIIGWSD